MTPQRAVKVSIIIPALNEEAILGKSLSALQGYLEERGVLSKSEVIVVAAATEDQTRVIARKSAENFPEFQLLTPPDRVGKGRDVRLGVQAARGAFILFMDADLATPLRHIEPTLRLLEQGADVVIGTRNLWRTHKEIRRRALSVASNILVQGLLLPGISDSQCGFKGFRNAAAHALFDVMTIEGWGFDMELLAIARAKNMQVVQLPVPDWDDPRPRGGLVGESTTQATWSTLKELQKIRSQVRMGRYV